MVGAHRGERVESLARVRSRVRVRARARVSVRVRVGARVHRVERLAVRPRQPIRRPWLGLGLGLGIRVS